MQMQMQMQMQKKKVLAVSGYFEGKVNNEICSDLFVYL